MLDLIKKIALYSTLFIATGCATVTKMPLQEKGKTDVSVSQKSILVAKVSIKNANKESQQPTICCVFLKKDNKDLSFTEPTLISDKEKEGKTYIVSMEVAPGTTTLNMIRFFRQVPLLVMAMADLPFDQTIEVPANKVVYLGNIDAVIVPRTDDSQPRAGSVIPLIDQAVAGFSNGTFTAKVTDKFDQDVAEIKSKFPKAANLDFVNMTLPQWKYPASAVKQDKAEK
jgi:hypothetical protein